MRTTSKILILGAAGALSMAPLHAVDGTPHRDPLVQVHESFDADPGWQGVNNRVVCDNCPTIAQNFGYQSTDQTGIGAGAIGGIVTRSRTPAWYAMKIAPLSFNDPFSASGRLVVMPSQQFGGAYFGLFNSTRQEWRPWSSMAIRIGDLHRGPPMAAESHVDYMSAGWKAGGYATVRIPVDRKPHTWSLNYEPNVTVPAEWPDRLLQQYLGTTKKPEEEILKIAKQAEPTITIEQLRERLNAASNLGLIEFHTRRGVGWEIRHEPAKVRGRITFRFDEGPPLAHFMNVAIREEAVSMDRFGIFNFQLPGWPTEFYLADLIVNGKRVDLSRDPQWEGHGNRTRFVEHDFHGKQDFGFSDTNFAGTRRGEIGGTFWRTEPVDPLHAWYADNIGALTLDDPISFSGAICFTNGGTDAGMRFGYFNSKDRAATFTLEQGGEAGEPMPNVMSMAIEGPTRIGYYLSAQLCPSERSRASHSEGPIFVPDGAKHRFSFDYDPVANKGIGRITMTVDGQPYHLNLNPEQRRAGATFDRFGVLNLRRGGKYVTVYFDDLTYTARRPANYRGVRHEQKVIAVPYPDGGRRY